MWGSPVSYAINKSLFAFQYIFTWIKSKVVWPLSIFSTELDINVRRRRSFELCVVISLWNLWNGFCLNGKKVRRRPYVNGFVMALHKLCSHTWACECQSMIHICSARKTRPWGLARITPSNSDERIVLEHILKLFIQVLY